MRKKTNTRTMIQISLLSVIAFLLMFFIEFPLLASAPFLQYDPSQVPTLIVTFAFGPLAGVVSELIKTFLFFVSGKATTGIVGVSAAFLAGGTFVLAAGLVYRYKRTFRGAIVALVAGVLVMTLSMTLANKFVFFPLWGIPEAQINQLLIAAVIPFNLIKGVITSVLTLLLYKRIHRLLS